MKLQFTFMLLLFLYLFPSCRQSNGPGIMCTEEYRMITVTLKDTISKPVILSHYFVKKTSTSEILDFAQEDPYFDSIMRQQGIYLLCTDGKMNMTSTNGTEFEFHGFIDTSEVVNEKYIIGNDRCHVIMLSGRPEIVISNR